MATICGYLLQERPEHPRRLLHFPLGVEGRCAHPHCPCLQCPSAAVGEGGTVKPSADGDARLAQPLSHLLAVHPVHSEGEHARLQGSVLC